jgi:putative adhesin
MTRQADQWAKITWKNSLSLRMKNGTSEGNIPYLPLNGPVRMSTGRRRIPLRRFTTHPAVLSVIALSIFAAGCTIGPTESGSFDRTTSVSGPIQLDLRNGSGHVEIRTGQPGQVHIHGEYSIWSLIWSNGQTNGQEVQAHPPIEQQGSVIRIGYQGEELNHVQINYTIYVPPETELRAQVGSGSLDVSGVKGPAVLHTGSGHITVMDINGDLDVETGSGTINLTGISGRVTATTGSGRIELNGIGGEIRASTGSGSLHISRSPGRINGRTSSGGIEADGVADDLHLTTGSGSVHIQGNPSLSSFWQIHTGSGSLTLDVPSNASFRLHAQAHSGRIESDIPVIMEEQTGRHELRGRIGSGSASVELEAGSGTIHIR